MKKLSLFTLLLILSVGAVFAKGVGSANVKFGKPDASGSRCSGKGICTISGSRIAGETISVSFELTAESEGSRDLSIVFDIDDLASTDPDEASLFVDGEGRPRADYSMNYTFMDEGLCRSLGVEPGELVISSGDYNYIERTSGSQVRVTYSLSVN